MRVCVSLYKKVMEVSCAALDGDADDFSSRAKCCVEADLFLSEIPRAFGLPGTESWTKACVCVCVRTEDCVCETQVSPPNFGMNRTVRWGWRGRLWPAASKSQSALHWDAQDSTVNIIRQSHSFALWTLLPFLFFLQPIKWKHLFYDSRLLLKRLRGHLTHGK